jgi:ABC-2 type transport system ATP-binding protein
MRMITGFIPPSGGTAVIGGFDITEDSISARKKIGYLPENAPVYPDMTVHGYLDFCAQIRGYGSADRKRKIHETIERCFLTRVEHQNISTLSKGYRQRVCFAQSILHDPEYLIFDEPTDGLDPNQKHEVRLMIREMSEKKAILLSTHILDEVESVCTRAVIIANGCIVADDTPDNLKTRSSVHGAVRITVADADGKALLSALEGMDCVKRVEIIEQDEQRINIRIYPGEQKIPIADRIMIYLREKNYKIQSLFVEQGRLDEVFRKITL